MLHNGRYNAQCSVVGLAFGQKFAEEEKFAVNKIESVSYNHNYSHSI